MSHSDASAMKTPPSATESGPNAASPDRSAAARAHDIVLALGRRAVATPDPDVLIADAARLIAEVAGTEFALIARGKGEFRQSLVSMTGEATSPPPDDSTDGTTLAEVAVNQAHPIVVPDLLHSDVYSDRYLVKNNVRGALIVPLRLQNASFGALGACSDQRIDFEVDAIYVAETIAHLVATTLAHYRSEALLEQSRQLTKTLFDTIDAVVLVVDDSGRVQTMNQACTEITGFTRDDFMDRPVWSVLAPPEDIDKYRDAIARLTSVGTTFPLEASLLTKHSDLRIIAWRFAASPNSRLGKQSFMLTGIDITQQRLAEERAERARKALAHLRSAGAGDSSPDAPSGTAPASRFSESGRSGELASGRIPTDTERRLRPRRPFPYVQNIAYVTGNTYPAEEEFIEVRCRDIAAGGFSFETTNAPQTEKLVVALGSPRHLTYLIARVVHVTQVVEDDQIVHLVGCKYTGRAPQ